MTSARSAFRHFPLDALVAGCWPLFAVVPLVVFFCAFFLRGTPWLVAYAGAMGLCMVGAAFITAAKLPLLRRGVLGSFGSRRLPFGRCRRLYRLGWRLVASGAVVTSLLLVGASAGYP